VVSKNTQPRKEKIIMSLKKQAKDSETVYIATDPDREGEAIGWNIKENILNLLSIGVLKIQKIK
jgi:DNA topoisomerase IA